MGLPSHTEVLIVGAGPVGLALAVSMAIRGIDAVLVDERSDAQETSRAAWVHSRTLEVRSWHFVMGA
jgi:2-polyprenyl-6-methoxyphenol hydroxylase-like FAD-dependent oxidoreductase